MFRISKMFRLIKKNVVIILEKIYISFREITFFISRLAFFHRKYSHMTNLKRRWGFFFALHLTVDDLLALEKDDVFNIKKKSNFFLFRFIYLNDNADVNDSRLNYKAWLTNSGEVKNYLKTYKINEKIKFVKDCGLNIKKSNSTNFLQMNIKHIYAFLVIMLTVCISAFFSFHHTNRFNSQFFSLGQQAESIYQLTLAQGTNIYQVEYFYSDSLRALQEQRFVDRAIMKKVIGSLDDFVFYYFNQNFNIYLNRDARAWATTLLNKKDNLTAMQRFARINFALQYINKRLLDTKSQITLFSQFFTKYFDFTLNRQFIAGYFRYLNQKRTNYIFVPDNIETYLFHTMHTPQQLYRWFAYQEKIKYGELTLNDLLTYQSGLQSNSTLPAYLYLDKSKNVKHDLKIFIAQLQYLPWLRRQFTMTMSSLYDLLWLSYQHDRYKAWLSFMRSLSVNNLAENNHLFFSIKQFLLLTSKNLNIPLTYPWQQYQLKIQQLIAQQHNFTLQDNPIQAKLMLAKQVYNHHANFLDKAVRQLSQPLLNFDDAALAKDYQFVLQLPFTAFFQQVLKSILSYDDKKFQRTVYPFYAKHIKNYFPFKLSKADAQVSAVKEFLQIKQGIFWSYVNANLNTFLFYQHGWHLRSWHGVTLPVAKKFMSQLNAYAALSDMAFKKNCLLHLSLYPLPVPVLVTQNIQYTGWHYHYSNGPQSWHDWCWPYHQQVLQYSVRLSHHKKNKIFYFYGHWAPLRLLVKAKSTHFPLTMLIKPGNLVSIINLLKHNNNLELIDDEEFTSQ